MKKPAGTLIPAGMSFGQTFMRGTVSYVSGI